MFKTLFLATLLVTLVVNILFLFAAKEKPPDLGASTFASIVLANQQQQQQHQQQETTASQRRLFLRSNSEFYDYSSSSSSLVSSSAPAERAPPAPLRANPTSQSPSELPGVLAEATQRQSIVESSSGQEEVDNHGDRGGDRGGRLAGARGWTASTTPTSNSERPPAGQQAVGATSDASLKGELGANERARTIQQTGDTGSGGAQQLVTGATANNGDPRPAASSSGGARTLDIRVKSSRNQVLVSVDGTIIYESKSKSWPTSGYGGSLGGRVRQQQQQQVQQQAQAAASRSIEDDADSTEGRGIHVLVLNQFDGRVLARRVFDTYSPGQDEELCLFVSLIRDGRLMVFAVKDEASFKMAPNSSARLLLQRLGSRHIQRLRWRDMWAFVCRKRTLMETSLRMGEPAASLVLPAPPAGSSSANANANANASDSQNLAEGLSKSASFSDWAPPVTLAAQVELASWPKGTSDGGGAECAWNSGDRDADLRRAEFCNQVEGYGRVCDCAHPAPISFSPAKIEGSQLGQVPLVVMASNRPYYLHRMLRSLLAADGVNASMVTVFIDGFYDEPLMVSRLFKLRAIQQRPLARRSARISHHYKASLTKTFELFPSAEFAIIFEEDLDVACDALVFFNQTLPVLRSDPSLYCASAWNDQGYEHSASDNRLLYRIETMPGLGWMLSRRLYKEELEPNWPSAEQPHDWDMWIRTEQVRKNRECLIPDVSRTYHFGATGTNINSYFQRQYFSKHAFYLGGGGGGGGGKALFKDLDRMGREEYERLVESLVSEASVLTMDDAKLLSAPPQPQPVDSEQADQEEDAIATKFLCSLANQTEQASKRLLGEQKHSVIFIQMIDKRDFGNWLRLARCWRIWDLDARGQHNSMWRLFLNGRPTLVVGVPASPYSKFKPTNVGPFKIL